MKILDIFEKRLRYKNYSERTIQMYIHYTKKFLIDTKTKDPYQLTTKVLFGYIHDYSYSSISQQNQIINSLKLFYKYILNKSNIHLDKIERPRKEKTLPRIIDKDYLLSKIEKIDNLKHKTIISLAYSVGLRVSEIINLKIVDIDSKRMVINIVQAKGRKDRIVPLTENMLLLLRDYFKKYRPIEYLFNGQNTLKYSSSSCNKIVKKYLGEEYHFHILRHSCFTNLTEQNVDIHAIQKLAGHNSSKTTEIYCQVSKKTLKNLPLAL